MSSEVRCEHCGKSLFHHSDCYARAKRYTEMLEFLRRIADRGCELVGPCDSCKAVSLLRKYGEKYEPKSRREEHV